MGHFDRYSDAFKEGKKRGEDAYSDFDYDRDKYSRFYGSDRQRDYTAGFDEAREERRYQERMREEREEQERQEQKQAELRAQERYEQECYEQQMYEEQQQYEQEVEEQEL